MKETDGGLRWLMLASVAVLAGFCLSRYVNQFWDDLFFQIHTYLKYGTHYETGVAPWQDACHLAILALCILLWSWADGYAIGQLSSGRATWVLAMLFYAMAQAGYFAYSILHGSADPGPSLAFAFFKRLLPLHPVDLLLAPALAWGLFLARKGVSPGRSSRLALAGSGLVLIALLLSTENWYQAVYEPLAGAASPWYRRCLPALVASGPLLYLGLDRRSRIKSSK